MIRTSFAVPSFMMVSAIGFELSIGSNRANAMCAATKNTVIVSATLTVAAMCFFFSRSSHPGIGPISSVTAANPAGSRNAANDSPVKSNKCDIDSV